MTDLPRLQNLQPGAQTDLTVDYGYQPMVGNPQVFAEMFGIEAEQLSDLDNEDQRINPDQDDDLIFYQRLALQLHMATIEAYGCKGLGPQSNPPNYFKGAIIPHVYNIARYRADYLAARKDVTKRYEDSKTAIAKLPLIGAFSTI